MSEAGSGGRRPTPPEITRIRERLAHRAGTRIPVQPPARRAAVSLILRHDAPSPELLLIKRATYAGDPWSGHIALPGGRMEPDDPTPQAGALRETLEETAIDLARDGEVLGTLDDVEPRTPRLPLIIITPFVALVYGDPIIHLSAEVAEAFWVPLALFRDPAISREVVLQLAGGPRTVPSFQVGDHTVWGLTERILRQFIDEVDV